MSPFSPAAAGTGVQRLPLWVMASMFYLFLPFLAFAAGWLKPWIAVLLLLLIGASAVTLLCGQGAVPRFSPARLRAAAIIALIAIGFAFLTGMWPALPQSNDYLKHNLIFGDLIERPWPVRYPGEDGGEYLCYGLGYYMIPAVIAKLCGAACIGVANFVWATAGFFLFFLGLSRVFPRHPAVGIVIFLLCSGLGALWFLVKSGFVSALLPPGTIPDSPWFTQIGLYYSNLDSFTRMFYQPQHGIPGWLGGLLIYELLVVRQRWTESAAVLSATFFWSPVTAAGLGFIGVVALLANGKTLVWRPTIHLVTALAVMSVMTGYYLPHLSIADKGFIWEVAGGKPWLLWYVLFVVCFVLAPAVAVFWLEWKQPYLGTMKPVVAGMVLLLLASPLYKLGYFGDLRMQISGPAFLFIALAMTHGLLQGPGRGRMLPFLFLLAVFAAGAMAPLVRTCENMLDGAKTDYRIKTLRNNGLGSIKDLRMTGFDVTAQYLGRSDAPSALRLLKDIDSNTQTK